ncbi:MAG: hypothetical protein ACRD4H_02085 [Candidatus Acidiferrales bacterium]
MKKSLIAFFFILSLTVSQVCSRDEHLHIHKELRIEIVHRVPTITSSPDLFYRVAAFTGARVGAGYLSRRFPTVAAAKQHAESNGYADSDFRIETVDADGRVTPTSRPPIEYPVLWYSGIRP